MEAEKKLKRDLKLFKDWLNDNHAGMYIKISDYMLDKYLNNLKQ